MSHYPTPDTPCADDQLTPNDEDPVAAVTTGSLLGEKDERMIELKILKSEPHEVCVCVCKGVVVVVVVVAGVGWLAVLMATVGW